MTEINFSILEPYLRGNEKFDVALRKVKRALEARPLYLYREVMLLRWLRKYFRRG